MANTKISKALAVFAASTMLSMATVQSAYAAPGTLATAPLFLSTVVEPNIYFTVDDSGSMDWNPVLAEGGDLPTSGGLPFIDGQQRAYYSPTFTRLYGTRYALPPSNTGGVYPEWDLGWMVRSHHANLNYFNPSVKYQPWPGTKADGSPMFTDADPTNALKDPFNPGGEKMDLTVPYVFTEGTKSAPLYLPTYYTWDDTDGDGIIEQTDGHTEVVIAPGTPEMQNFANWFQYYRSRMNATKSIIGTTINNTTAARMGMHQFNEGQLAAVASMTDAASKRNLLQPFYNYDVKGQGTPMRIGLANVGDYFDNIAGGPILSATNGGECQQNFNILIGDGFWNGSSPNIGNTDIDSPSDSSNFDGNAVESNDGGNYADAHRNTLADVAMRDYERDLRTDLKDRVPITPGLDLATHQHLVTYAISFGPIGTLDPIVDDPLSIGFQWPDPALGDAEKIDDMWHAAYNGRGKFLSANDPATLSRALNTAIEDIAQRTATAAAVSINSAKLTTESVVYLAQFNTNRWQGNLIAFKIIDLSTGQLAGSPQWTAADQLNSRNIVSRPRTILTHDGIKGVPFQWGSLSLAQKDDLKTSPSGGVDSDAVGMARLAYLRGDRSNEGTGLFLRERASLLADLVNSGPVFVGKPSLEWPDKAPFPTAIGQRYSDFKNGPAASRKGVVYAGSNGGMMHGFAEDDGEEVIAYVPNNLYSTGTSEGLHYLTDPGYGHRYYNDLTPTVSDIYADLGSGSKWQTILVSGERGGGRGIYALDITDPADFSEANAARIALWEFSSADDPDLGYTYSRPQIGLTNNGRWVAVFGNGYNDIGSGEAQLFIVDIAGGADGSWDAGDIIKISTGSGTALDRNGLATPALADLDGNGTVDRVYAGDLKGQLWAFDLSDPIASSWGIAGGAPLFTTINNKPITSKPAIAKHPTQSDDGTNAPNVMVYFGSGQYLVDADKTSVVLNHFYGVWDRGSNNLNNGNLVQQTYESGFIDASGEFVRVLSDNPVNYTGGQFGWYFKLPLSGERSVTNPVLRGGIVFFNSFVPVDDPCSVGGFGFRFAVKMENGGSPDKVIADYNKDGVLNDSDKATNGPKTDVIAAIRQEGYLPEPVFIEDISFTGETPSKVVKLRNLPRGRFSWQELIQ